MIWRATNISRYCCLWYTKLEIRVIFWSTTHSIIQTCLGPHFRNFVIIKRSISFCAYILAVKLIKLNLWHPWEISSYFLILLWAPADIIWPIRQIASFIYTKESAIDRFSIIWAFLIVSRTHYLNNRSVIPIACFYPDNLGVEFRPVITDIEAHHQYDNMKTKYNKTSTNA